MNKEDFRKAQYEFRPRMMVRKDTWQAVEETDEHSCGMLENDDGWLVFT